MPVVVVADLVGEVLEQRAAPKATLSSCIPRQIPSTGMSRSTARRASAISHAVALGDRSVGLGWGSAP